MSYVLSGFLVVGARKQVQLLFLHLDQRQISTRCSYQLRFLNVSGRRNAIWFLISIHTAQHGQVSYGF